MTLSIFPILFAIGLFGGAWNAVAGGATLFTFPALMAAGLPPMVANATNYLALLPSNAAALPAYRAELRDVGARAFPLLIVSGAGALTGSILLTQSDPAMFEALIPFLILCATGLFAGGDFLRRSLLTLAGPRASRSLALCALFLFSIYGGYFGAGLGIVLLGIVQFMGFATFHVANGLKNLLATSFTILSVAVFGVGGLIAWPEAAAMMCGSTLGGYLGGRYARRVDERMLRVVVIVFGLVLAAAYGWRTW